MVWMGGASGELAENDVLRGRRIDVTVAVQAPGRPENPFPGNGRRSAAPIRTPVAYGSLRSDRRKTCPRHSDRGSPSTQYTSTRQIYVNQQLDRAEDLTYFRSFSVEEWGPPQSAAPSR
jgi:hypothetical protein